MLFPPWNTAGIFPTTSVWSHRRILLSNFWKMYLNLTSVVIWEPLICIYQLDFFLKKFLRLHVRWLQFCICTAMDSSLLGNLKWKSLIPQSVGLPNTCRGFNTTKKECLVCNSIQQNGKTFQQNCGRFRFKPLPAWVGFPILAEWLDGVPASVSRCFPRESLWKIVH